MLAYSSEPRRAFGDVIYIYTGGRNVSLVRRRGSNECQSGYVSRSNSTILCGNLRSPGNPLCDKGDTGLWGILAACTKQNQVHPLSLLRHKRNILVCSSVPAASVARLTENASK